MWKKLALVVVAFAGSDRGRRHVGQRVVEARRAECAGQDRVGAELVRDQLGEEAVEVVGDGIRRHGPHGKPRRGRGPRMAGLPA